jgi:predicted nucleic acid-binding protein
LIVVDASAVLEVVLQTPAAAHISRRIFAAGETLHAPHLLDVEVAHALRRLVLSGAVSAARGAKAILDLADFPLRRYPHFDLLPRIWELRNNVTAYDAAYLALAEALGAPLVTCDRTLKSAVRGVRVEVV